MRKKDSGLQSGNEQQTFRIPDAHETRDTQHETSLRSLRLRSLPASLVCLPAEASTALSPRPDLLDSPQGPFECGPLPTASGPRTKDSKDRDARVTDPLWRKSATGQTRAAASHHSGGLPALTSYPPELQDTKADFQHRPRRP